MSDIRFNQWLHQSGTGGVSQDHIGNIGIGTTNPSIVVSAANTAVLNVGVITANNLFVNNAFNGDITGNVTGNISGATGTFSGNVDIADKIIHTGDTDTAMRFPADNTFAVDTAGSERLRITSDGKMGVGCTPETDFQVRNGNGGTVKIGGSGNSATGFQIQYNNSGTTTTELLTNYRSTSSSASLKIDTGTFLVATGTNGAERLRITSDGKIGVNNTSPFSDLQVITAGQTEDGTFRIGGSQASLGLVLDYDQSSNTVSRITANPTYTNTNSLLKICVDGDANPNQLVLKGDGKLGHGTASPSSAFHGTVSSGGYGATFESTANGGESVVTIKGKKSDGTVRSAIFKYDNADMIRLGTSQSIPMRFETGDTERLKIYSDGRVIIHGNGTIRTAWSGAVCSINNLAMMDAGSGFSWGLRANSGDTQWCLERIVGTNSFSDSNIKFRVYNNGNYSFAGSSTSDRDIKENIEDISGTSLNLIDQLRPRTFNFKESEGYSTEPKTGFVAQEIGAVIPSIVNGTDGQKDMGVDYNGLVAHLVKAVQELKAENDSLRSRLDTAGL